jgi:DNA repair protein RecO
VLPADSLAAINLRTYPLGENDKIVVAFSRERGIVRLAARGARKTGNRWAGRLEPLARNIFQVTLGRGSLDRLVGADTRVSGAGLLGDLDRLLAGLLMAEVTHALMPEHEPNPEVWDTLEHALDLLLERLPPSLVGLWFELEILDLAGYRPDFTEDRSRVGRLLGAIQGAEARQLREAAPVPPEVALDAARILAGVVERHAQTEIRSSDLMRRLALS